MDFKSFSFSLCLEMVTVKSYSRKQDLASFQLKMVTVKSYSRKQDLASFQIILSQWNEKSNILTSKIKKNINIFDSYLDEEFNWYLLFSKIRVLLGDFLALDTYLSNSS